MIEVSIRVCTRAGDMSADYERPLNISESGTAYVREGIVDAANKILRGYGLKEIEVPKP